MSSIDPASRIRPDWWTDETFINLCALEDQALPNKGLSPAEEAHPTQPVLRALLSAMWSLGKTGGITDGTRDEAVVEALQCAEWSVTKAAQAARLTLSRLVEHHEDDEEAEAERNCENTDPAWGPPHARLTEASFTVRLPGHSGDTVAGSFNVDEQGHLTFRGNGPLSAPTTLGRLEARAVIKAIEDLVALLSQTAATEDDQVSPF
ncbi:hypothetical protein [Streptomyces sp. NBC_01546]|uniref:hypothetical protein n=1 Tax=Streptomyces sp. NBC_01546 TaxID=2975872 RepID=UPI002F90F670